MCLTYRLNCIVAPDLYVSGREADILVVVNDRGTSPVSDFIDKLDRSDQIKIARLLLEFAERGEIVNTEKFKIEEKPIYAFKARQVRILCFFLPNAQRKTVVLTNGFIKKSQKLPRTELERARKIYSEVAGMHQEGGVQS